MSYKCYLVNNEKFFETLENFNFEQSYSGKGGCACGCGGEYKEGEKTKKRVINQFKKLFNEGAEINIQVSSSFIVCFEGDTSVYALKRRVKRMYFEVGEYDKTYLTEIDGF